MIIRNMSSTAGMNALKALASFMVSFAVARVVSPGAFGLVAFSIPLMTFITLLTDFGLTSAMVRHPELSRSEAGAAIALMGITGLVGGALLAGSAGALEAALALHGLQPVLIGYGLVTLLSIWAAGPRALLERRYVYTTIAIVEGVALAAALAVFAASLALAPGIMSFVFFQVVLQLVRALGFIVLSRDMFRLNLAVGKVLPLAQIGGWVLLTNLSSYLARNLDRILIGAYLGAASLGIYGLAYQFMTIPLVLITWPVSGVLLSTLARLRAAPQAARVDVICAVLTGTAAITFPTMGFLTFGARFPIEAVYAARWDGLAAIVALLAPVGAVQSISAFGGAVLTEKGAVRLNFVLGLLNGCILSCVFFASVWFGLATVVAAYMAGAVLVSVMLIYYMCREAGISARRFGFCLVPGTLAALVGAAASEAVTGLSPQTWRQWALCVLVYCLGMLGVYGAIRQHLFGPLRALARSGSAIAGLGRA
jgi:O-antigen/teichoic acid export membrane protein